MIIVIDGTDGCGKKTQTELLFNFLVNKGYKCKLISFPNYESPSSAGVKMYLSGQLGKDVNCLDGYQTSVLYAVDRLLTMKQVNVEDYDYVILDRYITSNMIHQSKNMNLKQIDEYLKWLCEFEYGYLKLPKPDKILFLDMRVDLSLKLAHARAEYKTGDKKDIHEEDDEYMKHCYENAKYIAKKFNWTEIKCFEGDNVKSIDEIHKDILTKLGLK